MRYLILVFSLLSFNPAFSQTEEEAKEEKQKVVRPNQKEVELASFPRRGIVKHMATISPGIMLSPVLSNIYFQTNFSYYSEDQVSLKADLYYYINTIEDYKPFSMNHSLLLGACYHLLKQSQIDPFIGIQPGLARAKRSAENLITKDDSPYSFNGEGNKTLNPLLTAVAGVNFYAKKTFQMSVSVRYVNGDLLSYAPPLNLDEIRIAFGLGWYIKTIKPKDKTLPKAPESSMGK